MIKCKCIKCGDESVYKTHKDAWMEGWDFVNNNAYCVKCAEFPTKNVSVKPEVGNE